MGGEALGGLAVRVEAKDGALVGGILSDFLVKGLGKYVGVLGEKGAVEVDKKRPGRKGVGQIMGDLDGSLE